MRKTLRTEDVAAAIRHAPYSSQLRQEIALEISLRIFPQWSEDEETFLTLCKREDER